MPDNNSNNTYLKFFLGLLSTAVIGLFIWIWAAQSTLTTLSLEFNNLRKEIVVMSKEAKEMREDTDTDIKQNDSITKHWKLHSWTRHQINELERKNDMPLSAWPDF